MELKWNINFAELQTLKGLQKLDQIFCQFLQNYDQDSFEMLVHMRHKTAEVSKLAYSNFLINCAPILDDFLSELFSIQEENELIKKRQSNFDIIYECKRKFIIRHALKKYGFRDISGTDFESIQNQLTEYIGSLDDKNLARKILFWLEDTELYCKEIDVAARYAAYKVYSNSPGDLYDVPRKIDESCHLRNYKIEQLKQAPYLGFSYRDRQQNLEKALSESKYCIYCHNQEKDYCSTGLPNAEDKNGCPLGQKISEMNKVKDLGYNIGALGIITIDNPLVAITGHRICNDCMKSCIFQKQDPVNVPIVESNILDIVLSLGFGVEIYLLLTKWNPLNIYDPLPKKPTNYNILVAGLGPAGCALSHYLMQEGHNVVAIDGLKVTPLFKGNREPIRNWSNIKSDLAGRMPQGFGGVAEYGITNRWDKNYLLLIRLMLERRENFQIYDGVRLGSNLTISQSFELGFDHVALSIGAGRPKFMTSKNFFVKGVKSAADFLMALSQGGAFLPDSNTKLQIRLPALVIGCGLTAVDSAVEIVHYYQIQVEKFLSYYEQIPVKPELSKEDQQIKDEFLEHARLLRSAKSDHEKLKIMQDLGFVKLCYRGKIINSPAYKRNHEEIEHAMALGIEFLEDMEPLEVIKDEFDSAMALKFTNGQILPAKTILIAIGTEANSFVDLDVSNYGNKVSYFGDCDTDYAGSVVKALASVKNGYKEVSRKLKNDQPRYKLDYKSLLHNLNEKLGVTIEEVEQLAKDRLKVVVYSKSSAENFLPGQFFRLQNYASSIKKATKPIALRPVNVDKQNGLITFLIQMLGPSTRLCQNFVKGERIMLMGPVGTGVEISAGKKILLIGEQIMIHALEPIAKALRESNSTVTIINYSDLQNLENSAKFDQVICNLSCKNAEYIQQNASALFGSAEVILQLNSPMGCMMKGICGCCISRLKDGKYIFACADNIHQMQDVDLESLDNRLKQNALMDKLMD